MSKNNNSKKFTIIFKREFFKLWGAKKFSN